MKVRRTLFIAAAALFWLLVGLFIFLEMAVFHPIPGNFNTEGELVWELALSVVWALSTPLIVWLARRYRLDHGAWARPLAVHILAGITLALLQCGVHGLIVKAIMNPGPPLALALLLPSFYFNIDKMLMIYAVIVLVTHAVDYYGRLKEKEIKTLQLESQLVKAELSALKMQLQPHFLFNTLNAISSLMHSDVESADRMIVRLGDLLRLTLDSSGLQTARLKDEIDVLKKYIEIEQIRFKDRLRVDLDIAPEVLEAKLPTLILQPLVENAIRHGIAPRAAGGHVAISARRAGTVLELRVTDDGVGMPKEPSEGDREGVGISNTRSRLEKLYGSDFRLEIADGEKNGVSAILSLPLDLPGVGELDHPARP